MTQSEALALATARWGDGAMVFDHRDMTPAHVTVGHAVDYPEIGLYGYAPQGTGATWDEACARAGLT